MFTERGFSILLNDDILSSILIIGNVLGGLIVMLLTFAYAKIVSVTSVNLSLLTSLGFCSGYLMFSLTMSVVSSAVAAVCVCYAEKPEIFEVTVRPNKMITIKKIYFLSIACDLLFILPKLLSFFLYSSLFICPPISLPIYLFDSL